MHDANWNHSGDDESAGVCGSVCSPNRESSHRHWYLTGGSRHCMDVEDGKNKSLGDMIELVVLFVCISLGVWLLANSRWSSRDVLRGLEEPLIHRFENTRSAMKRDQISQRNSHAEYRAAGLLDSHERNQFEQQVRYVPLSVALMLAGICLILTGNFLITLILFSLGLSGGYLYMRWTLFRRKREFLADIDFFLPVVMERLVMAAQAGLDIFSGIRVATKLAQEEVIRSGENRDPVTRLLERVLSLHERGVSFEEALSQVAIDIESPALRHSFIHLSVAQNQGGELVQPLRELSDSTQLYYQETVDEQIAKLPVKATIPLVITFAGLVIFFMTSPLIQILKLSTEEFVK